MIHGSKRAKKQKSQQQLKDQLQLSEKINNKLAEFFAIPRKEVTSQQIPKYLQFIGLLMQLVSDIPTVFNFRRELINQSILNKSPQQIAKIFAGEIKLTTKLIQSDSKSYTIWSYRQWLVKSLFKFNSDIIKAEKELIKMLLMKDQKNFHVWNYRNWLNSIQSFIDEEITYTDQKIKSNPFNFSPYHFRSKFIYQKYTQMLQTEITSQLHQQILTFGMPKSQMVQEFQKVKTAIFLNPNQQAPWLYYNWLLGQLVPAFVITQQKKGNYLEIKLNMKVGQFLQLFENQNISNVDPSTRQFSDTWRFNSPNNSQSVSSNLLKRKKITLQTTGRLFLGSSIDKKLIDQNIKAIFKKELDFLEEVIGSQEQAKCRFAFLQKSIIYKLILQCGTSQTEFASVATNGLKTVLNIENQPKANKYIKKQIQYWKRLGRNQLTSTEQALKRLYQ